MHQPAGRLAQRWLSWQISVVFLSHLNKLQYILELRHNDFLVCSNCDLVGLSVSVYIENITRKFYPLSYWYPLLFLFIIAIIIIIIVVVIIINA
jgi:hypothetical protein